MGKYAQWTTHKGVKILYFDVGGLSEAEILEAMEELKQELLKDRSGPPLLFDQGGAPMTQATSRKAKEVFKALTDAGYPNSPSAIVGLTRLQKVVIQLLGQGVHYCESVDEAKDWLAAEETRRAAAVKR